MHITTFLSTFAPCSGLAAGEHMRAIRLACSFPWALGTECIASHPLLTPLRDICSTLSDLVSHFSGCHALQSLCFVYLITRYFLLHFGHSDPSARSLYTILCSLSHTSAPLPRHPYLRSDSVLSELR
jgi:hypothetical protein